MTTSFQSHWRRPSTLARASGLIFAGCLLAYFSGAVAQSTTQPPATVANTKGLIYDAVSIKPNKTGSGSWSIKSSDARYSAKNVSVQSLLEQAYGIRKELISGVDGPIAAARFDIEAKIVEPDPVLMKDLPPEQYRAMVLELLQEHFGLVAHTESKTAAVYELEVTKDGPKFKQSVDADGKNSGTNIHNRELEAKGITMTQLATTLTDQVQRTVVDKTGLAAMYDLKLKWSAEDSAGADDCTKDAPPVIFTAIREQLGLKLQPGKGTVVTLVVDHVEMPSEN